MQREMIFQAEPKYGGLLVHIDDTDRYDYHTKNPACTGEVVRCRDCKSVQNTLRFSDWAHGSADTNVPFCATLRREVDPDGFCWLGERRE